MKKKESTTKFANDYLSSRTSRLEEIMNAFSANSFPLHELIDMYEEGTVLIKECKAYLNQMEGRIIDITNTANADDQK